MSLRSVCLFAIGSVIIPFSVSVAGDAHCDRKCLRSTADAYLTALVNRDASQLSTSADFRLTENAKTIDVHSGLWSSATSLGDYRQYFEDPASQQVVFIGVVNEGDAKAILALRLAVRDQRIAEAEHIAARKGSHPLFAPQAFSQPNSLMNTPVAADKRLSRERLIAIAQTYFDGIEAHSSKRILAADQCDRIENGLKMTHRPNNPDSGNCAQSADRLTYIKDITNRRFPVVDPALGVVVSTILFEIPGGEPMPGSGSPASSASSTSQGGADSAQVRQALRQPRMLLLTEWFKIDEGEIQHIEAVMHNLPHGSTSGWPDESW